MIVVKVDGTEITRKFEEEEHNSGDYEYQEDEFVIRGRVFAPDHEAPDIATRLEEALVGVEFDDWTEAAWVLEEAGDVPSLR